MSVPFIGGGSDIQQNTNVTNAAIRQLNSMENVQVFKDDTGTRRVILDKDGLRTSPAGVDVFTATASQFTFNSANNVFKIVSQGTITTTTLSTNPPANEYGFSETTQNIAHGLGYAPIIIAYQYDSVSGAYVPLPYSSAARGAANAAVWENYSISVNATNVTMYQSILSYNMAASSGGFSIKYYLLQETAN